jgi:hypothetical protein
LDATDTWTVPCASLGCGAFGLLDGLRLVRQVGSSIVSVRLEGLP